MLVGLLTWCSEHATSNRREALRTCSFRFVLSTKTVLQALRSKPNDFKHPAMESDVPGCPFLVGRWRYWVCRPALAWHLLEEFDGRHALAIEASELMNNLTPRGHQICVMFRTPLRANWRTCVGLTAKRVTPPRAAQGLSACPPTRTSRTRGHPEQPPCPWPGRPRKRPLDRRRPEGPSQ